MTWPEGGRRSKVEGGASLSTFPSMPPTLRTALRRTALRRTALRRTALRRTALRRTALRRTALRRTAQNFALFLPFPAIISFFLCPTRPGRRGSAPALKTPPKFNEKTPRETQKERNDGGKGKKKREILGLPPFGAPPFGAPLFLRLGLHPLGPPPFWGPLFFQGRRLNVRQKCLSPSRLTDHTHAANPAWRWSASTSHERGVSPSDRPMRAPEAQETCCDCLRSCTREDGSPPHPPSLLGPPLQETRFSSSLCLRQLRDECARLRRPPAPHIHSQHDQARATARSHQLWVSPLFAPPGPREDHAVYVRTPPSQ